MMFWLKFKKKIQIIPDKNYILRQESAPHKKRKETFEIKKKATCAIKYLFATVSQVDILDQDTDPATQMSTNPDLQPWSYVW
jgi:hypothetical protein